MRKDEDNDPVFSCALTQVEFNQEKSQLKGQAVQAYQVLLNLVLEAGFDHKPKSGMELKKVIRLDDFKDHFIKAGIAVSDKPDSINKAFLRAKNTMKKGGYIAEWDGCIWITDKQDK